MAEHHSGSHSVEEGKILRTRTVTISDKSSRDCGRTYHLTEMPAARAEKWGMRAIFLAVRAGADVGDAARVGGMAGVATMGVQTLLGGVPFVEIEPLLDEMMGCVQFCPDPVRPDTPRSGPILPGEIWEPGTYSRLRAEVFDLHAGFSIGELLSTLVGRTTVPSSPSRSTSQES